MNAKHVWVTVSIVAIWIAVAVSVGVGGEFRSQDGRQMTEIPVAWGIVVGATVATAVVAFFGYREAS